MLLGNGNDTNCLRFRIILSNLLHVHVFTNNDYNCDES